MVFLLGYIFDALLASLLLLAYTLFRRLERRRLSPPSPPGAPIFGNLFDIPPTKQWVKFLAWSKELNSGIICVSLLGNRLIVLNDAETVGELLEKRGSIYCSRPRMPYAHEGAGLVWNWGFSGVPELWKPARREFEAHTRQAMARNYHDKETLMARQTMKKIIDNPTDFFDHCRFASGAFILNMIYGMNDSEEAASFINEFDHGSETFQKSANRNIIDVLPWIRHIPVSLSFLPGLGWRRQVEDVKEWGFRMRDRPLEWHQSNNSRRVGSVAEDILVRLKGSVADEKDRLRFVRDIIGVAFTAGTTTIGAFRYIIMIMILFPEVQQQARQQLDHVVGRDRLPDFGDKLRLPYIMAICKELIRWTSPPSLPHAPSQDDYYKGYFIPKGSTVIANTWALLHDPIIYPSPELFLPNRFLSPDGELDPDVPDPMIGFGFGRRICPGRYIALDELFIFTASLVFAFNISPAKDASGNDICPTPNNGEGVVGYPDRFVCKIEPRSEQAKSLIVEALHLS